MSSAPINDGLVKAATNETGHASWFGDLALPFGMAKDGKMIPVCDVPSGLACECVCPECNRRLVAKKGDVIRHHFAHESDSACAGGFETMAHRLAKQIIADEMRLFVPPVIAEVGTTTKVIHRAMWLTFDSVSLELWCAGLRPDIVGRLNGRELAIEVYVTHRCEAEKIETLRQRGIATVEIDLGEFRRNFDQDAFRQAVLQTAPRWWVFNAILESEQKKLDAELTEARYWAEVRRQQAELAEQERLELERIRDQERLAKEAEKEADRAEVARLQLEKWQAISAAQKAAQAIKDEQARIKRDAEMTERFKNFRMEITAAAFRELGAAEADNWLSSGILRCGSPGVNRLNYMPRRPRDYWDELRDYGSALSRNKASLRQFQDDLARVAITHFRNQEMADLWLRSSNPKLGMKTPMGVAVNEAGLDMCRKVLK